MKTSQAIEKAGSSAELAKLFGITPGAVSQWGEELPNGRYWQLRVMRPKWFAGEKINRIKSPRKATK